MVLEERIEALKNCILTKNEEWKAVELALKNDLPIKSRQEIKPLETGMGMEVIHYIEKSSGEVKQWTEKYINNPRNEEITNIECDFCAYSKIGVGYVKRNVKGKTYTFTGFIHKETKKEFLLGIRAEDNENKYIYLDLGLEFGDTSHWVAIDKDAFELDKYLKKMLAKGIITEQDYNLINMSLSPTLALEYFENTVIDINETLNFVDNAILSIDSLKEEDTKLKLTYEHTKSAIILSSELDEFLQSVKASGKLIFPLPILARNFDAYFIAEDDIKDFLALYGGNKLYVNSLENLNAAEFYVKNENLDFQKIDVTPNYQIRGSREPAVKPFTNLNEFDQVLEQASRWVEINLDVKIKNENRLCWLFSTSHATSSAKKIFAEEV